MTGMEWFVAIMTFVAMTITMTLWLQEGETFKNLHSLKYPKHNFRILTIDEDRYLIGTYTDGASILLSYSRGARKEIENIVYMLEMNHDKELYVKARVDPTTFEILKVYGYFFRPKQGGTEHADD